MRQYLLFLLTVSCGSANTTSNSTYPNIPLIWTEAISGGGTPIKFNDLLITDELDKDHQGTIGEVAFDLPLRKVRWRKPEVFYGHNSIVHKNNLIYFNNTDRLISINSEGKVVGVAKLPKAISATDNLDLLFLRSKQGAPSLVILPFKQSVISYSATEFSSSNNSISPLWHYEATSSLQGLTSNIVSVSINEGESALYILEREFNGSETGGRNYLAKINLDDGKKLWRINLNSSNGLERDHLGKIASSGGKIFIHLQGTSFIAAYTTEGNIIWKSKNILCPSGETNILSHLIAQADTLIISPFGDRCYTVLDQQTGEKRFVFSPPVGGSFGQIPTFLNGVMYATNGFLWAVDAKNGKILGRSETDLPRAQGKTGTVIYDEPRKQLLIWSEQLSAFKPIR